ncbi:hypothetical protein [Methylocystis parvus]|uniref:Uncharacterized protein n=1 Tax=Methylocystis parvus TaxID=134 RepID=A0A6B8M4I2_9HYPH|nr:hypothetical protein [Methylocystis parvus]QGM97801.1 hypothetical protein F7D14_10195 [Methylocystis parvus]WBK01891.1 hypothetical protein MMG94_09385 [Methylocystis parvus OBBP]
MSVEDGKIIRAAAAAAIAERARIATILNHESAKGREALARHFALETDMTASDAVSALAVAPSGYSVQEVELAKGSAEMRRILGK